MSQDFRLKYSRNYEKKRAHGNVEVLKGQKMVNSATYKIYMEDHTLGDLLRIYLLKNTEQVKFAGHRVPHPLVDEVEIKVQTKHQDTNRVVKETLHTLQLVLLDLQNSFELLADEKMKEVR